MNCQEALDLLYDILDKEASEVDAQQVQEHIHRCQHCFEVYRLEGDLHAFIKERLTHSTPTVHAESLRVKILTQLDSIDREEGAATGKKPPFWRTSYTLAAAALLVIMFGAAYLIAGYVRHQDLYFPLEKAHWATMDEPGDYHDPASTAAAMAFAADSAGYSLFPDVKNEHLIGGMTTEIDGTRMAQFVYATSSLNDPVSVFVVPAANFSIPDNLAKTRVTRNGHELFDHHCRGCRLVYQRVGDAIIITATTDHSYDLLDFIPGQASI